jgi:hypothetical protein
MPTVAPPKPETAQAGIKPQGRVSLLQAPVREIALKGFIKKAETGPYFNAMCLDLNLAVRGKSLQDAESRLRELIDAYLQDALRSGWDAMVPRRAPASYYAEYYILRIKASFHALADSKLFVENVPTPAHA